MILTQKQKTAKDHLELEGEHGLAEPLTSDFQRADRERLCAHVCVYGHVCVCVCVNICLHMYICVCTHACVCECVCEHVSVCATRMRACVCACLSLPAGSAVAAAAAPGAWSRHRAAQDAPTREVISRRARSPSTENPEEESAGVHARLGARSPN